MRAPALPWKSLALLLSLLAGTLQAKVYYVNKGVLYHIGDDRFAASTDAAFVGAYPVVGQEWIQAFTVDRSDHVKVHIEVIRGVDDCPYCKDLVSIDDSFMGRLYAENNGKTFDSPAPLDKAVEPGKVYYLKIASIGLEADDFVIGNVVVETDKAELTLLEPGPIIKNPGEPLPPVYRPGPVARASAPCSDLPPNRDWRLGWKDGAAAVLDLDGDGAFRPSSPVAGLKAGQALEVDFQVGALGSKDAVSQVFECLVGAEPYSGWALLFSSQGALQHGNLLIQGDYSEQRLATASYQSGALNRLRVERCTDGKLRASLNGRDLGQALDCPDDLALISFRAQGLRAQIKSAAAR
jgi:hypothetical protein